MHDCWVLFVIQIGAVLGAKNGCGTIEAQKKLNCTFLLVELRSSGKAKPRSRDKK